MRRLGAGLVVAAALAACGGSSTVTPSSYVKSICTALGSWKQEIQSAGQALQASGIATGSPANAKAQYLRFVSTLLSATQRTARSLKAAGTPRVTGGAALAGGLSGGFARGAQGLSSALARASSMPTASTSAFQSAAVGVTGQVRLALSSIAAIPPRSNPQLRTAALKEPRCQALAG